MASALDGNVGIVTFVAEFDYVPQVGGEIELHKDDHCIVAKPIIDPLGWLEGTNKNTGEYGQFPGTYVRVIANYTPPPPPRPPKPGSSPRGNKKPAIDWSIINNHRLEKIRFTKPIWCEECHEFIWGMNRDCFWCSECFSASHVGCSFYFNSIDCDPDRRYIFDYEKADLLRPIEHWSNEDVLEWIAAIRALQYIQLFKEKNVTGATLYKIDEAYLKKILGIPHDFDIRSISIALEELLKGTDQVASSNALLPFVPTPAENFSDSARSAVSSHSWREHTFTTITSCDVCRKCMFGLIRQGLICKDCGIQCHRYCVQYGVTACKKKYRRPRRSSDAEDPSFGQDLSTSSTDIPLCIEKMAASIEEKRSTTKDIYLNTVPFLEILSMRNALNQAPQSVDMKNNDWKDPNIAATALKQYLLEMPASIITPEKYEDFIIAAKLSMGTDHQPIRRQFKELPKRNGTLLEFMRAHLIRVCDVNDPVAIIKVCKIFGVLLLRPFENDSRKLVKNLDYHSKVVEILLSGAANCQTPSVPVRQPTIRKPSLDPRNLESAEWYWGSLTREAASEKLKETTDGTFLIRDSQERGVYTLTLRKDGANKLIKIYQKDGKYGFTDSSAFSSLFALVDHFSNHSLKEYNPKLDIRLLYPVSKYENLPDLPMGQLEQELQDVSTKMGRYNALDEKLIEDLKEVDEAKSLLDAQTEVVYLIEEHISLANAKLPEVSPNDRAILTDTISRMRQRLENEKRTLKEADDLFRKRNEECTVTEKYLNDMKFEMPQIKQRYNELKRKLKDRNPDREKYFNDMEEEGIYDELPAMTYQTQYEELPRESWMLGRVRRDVVRQMLNGKPDGTFFIRESESNNNHFVISLVHDQSIKHITIERGPNGYGFAEPYNIYPDFQSLVHHYHKQSLRMHNPKLDITLMFPIRYLEDDV